MTWVCLLQPGRTLMLQPAWVPASNHHHPSSECFETVGCCVCSSLALHAQHNKHTRKCQDAGPHRTRVRTGGFHCVPFGAEWGCDATLMLVQASEPRHQVDQCLCCLPTRHAGRARLRFTAVSCGEAVCFRPESTRVEREQETSTKHRIPNDPASSPTPSTAHSSAKAATPAAIATSTRDTTAAPAADPGAAPLQASDHAAAPTHAVPVSRLGPVGLSASSQGAFCSTCRLRAREPPHLWVLSPGQGVVQPVLGATAVARSTA